MKFILGSGPSALILGHYLKDYQIIGPGLDTPLLAGGPAILWETKDTWRFMKELGITEEPKDIKIKYFFNEKIEDSRNAQMESVYRIKMNTERKGMIGGKTQIRGWDLKKTEVIKKLAEELDVRFTKGIVTKIKTLDKKLLLVTPEEGERYIDYELPLISTIPLPNMMNLIAKGRVILMDHGMKFEYFPLCFYHVEKLPPDLRGDYDMLYVIDLDSPIHRVSKMEDGYCLESFTNSLRPPELLYGKSSIVIHEFGRIMKDINVLEIDGQIKNVGRYSQWTHNIRMHDVVRRAKELASS